VNPGFRVTDQIVTNPCRDVPVDCCINRHDAASRRPAPRAGQAGRTTTRRRGSSPSEADSTPSSPAIVS
jgi:hypothetical protein